MNGTIETIGKFFSSFSKQTEKLKHIIETYSFETLEFNAVKNKMFKQ